MKSLSDLWDSILARLSGELSDMTIKTWFDEITVVTMEDSALVLHCSNPFKKNTVEARFLPHIKAALKDIFSTDLEVKILSDEQLAAYHGVAPDRPGNLFDSDAFTFETYVVGPQNKLAYAAAKAVAEKPAEGFNPLFIYGESGLGKTHLLYAIAHLMRSRRPESRIVYIKGDDFTNELVSSIRENRNAEFREKYRQADILLVDDIQFIAGKIQTQEEFFHTFNTLYESGKQIVLTSDRPPREMTQLSDRLMSRFESGLMVDVAPPDFETRLAIIHNKAALLGVKLPNEVMDYIAENVTTNVRQLEGTLNKILAYRDLLETRWTRNPWAAPSAICSSVATSTFLLPRSSSAISAATTTSTRRHCGDRAAAATWWQPVSWPCISSGGCTPRRWTASARSSATATTPPSSTPWTRWKSRCRPIPSSPSGSRRSPPTSAASDKVFSTEIVVSTWKNGGKKENGGERWKSSLPFPEKEWKINLCPTRASGKFPQKFSLLLTLLKMND